MTVSKALAKLSAAEFVDDHPELFALYHGLMVETLSCINSERSKLNVRIDSCLDAVQKRFEQRKRRAESDYGISTLEVVWGYEKAVHALQQKLEQTTALLDAERRVAREPIDKEIVAQHERLSFRYGRAASQCYRELGLEDRAFDPERDRQFYTQVTDLHWELRKHSEKIYSDGCAAAHTEYNQQLASLNEKVNIICRPAETRRSEAMQMAERNKHKTVSRLERQRANETKKLEAWIVALQNQRLKLIEHFLETQESMVFKAGIERELELVRAYKPN